MDGTRNDGGEALARRPRLKCPALVEGKYDKLRLLSVAEGTVFTADGFRLFGDRRRLAFFRRLAETQGLIVLMDSDGAGFRLRSYLTGAIGDTGRLIHVYTPDVYGKESRKAAPSAEGKLGVEGLDAAVLLPALERAGALAGAVEEKRRTISKAELFALGLSGRPDSAARRAALLRELALPEHLQANGLLDALNLLIDRDGLRAVCGALFGPERGEREQDDL